MIDESWYKRPEDIRERTSSGGVVVRLENSEILIALVGEIGVPDYVLPKGGVESGENLEQAARREIEEEAGLTSLALVGKLGTRERLAYDKSCWLTTHFYLFLTEQVNGVPTDTEHHYGMAWYPIGALPAIFWPEQQELIETNRDKITALIEQHLQ